MTKAISKSVRGPKYIYMPTEADESPWNVGLRPIKFQSVFIISSNASHADVGDWNTGNFAGTVSLHSLRPGKAYERITK